jgi:threonine/homoserine/homoserine lactone efflux protein
MGGVIGDLLPLAVGVAISPIPVIAVILMLLSRKPGAASIGFGIGWVVGIVVGTVVFLVISRNADLDTDSGPSKAASWVKLVLGVLLLLLAAMQWRKRPKPDEVAVLPKWMSAIEGFTPVKAAGLAFALSAFNPKNLLMFVSAGVAIGTAQLSVGGDVVAVAVFTVLAASTVLVPVIGFLVAAERVKPWLDTLKTWLEANNATVMGVLLLVLGVVQLGKGLGGLF